MYIPKIKQKVISMILAVIFISMLYYSCSDSNNDMHNGNNDHMNNGNNGDMHNNNKE